MKSPLALNTGVAAVVLLSLACLAGCGQTGPLYMPKPPTKPAAPPPPQTPSVSTPASQTP